MRASPSLNALRAFVTIARHRNLKAAASELFVTPSALSHQIRGLEETLEVRLFDRSPTGLTLTPAGESLLPQLAEGFELIDRAIIQLQRRRHHDELLSISMLSTFAMRWFIPRLSSFQRLHPEIEVRISTSVSLVDFAREDIDCAIRSGNGDWPGLHTVYLFSETLAPVCSPKLLSDGAPLQKPEDLVRHTLLQARLRPDDWHIWLHAAGAGDISPAHELEFETRNFAIQAAVDGVGIAIVDPSLVGEELRAGKLVMPFEHTLTQDNAYYFVCPQENRGLPRIQALENWLLKQADNA
jgi:LysR family glycine cleavage system transcriptional activator